MIYLDSCIVIYALESGTHQEPVRRALAAHRQENFAISPLVVQECLVGPIRAGDDMLRRRYLEFFERLEMIPLDVETFIRAAEIRARTSLRTPDALHLAAAELARCQELWTNDSRLATASHGLAVDVIGRRDRDS